MNKTRKKTTYKKAKNIFLCVLNILFLLSCTTIDPQYAPEQGFSFRENLNNLVNELTYDEALMTWGEPASLFKGDEIFIATWGNRSSGSALFPIENTWFAMPIENGWKLQLSFNKKTRKLVSWKYDKW